LFFGCLGRREEVSEVQAIGRPTVRQAMSGDPPVVEPLDAAANMRRVAVGGRISRLELVVLPGWHGQPATTQARWIGRPTTSVCPVLLLLMWSSPFVEHPSRMRGDNVGRAPRAHH
jgi:hypothetical protein